MVTIFGMILDADAVAKIEKSLESEIGSGNGFIEENTFKLVKNIFLSSEFYDIVVKNCVPTVEMLIGTDDEAIAVHAASILDEKTYDDFLDFADITNPVADKEYEFKDLKVYAMIKEMLMGQSSVYNIIVNFYNLPVLLKVHRDWLSAESRKVVNSTAFKVELFRTITEANFDAYNAVNSQKYFEHIFFKFIVSKTKMKTLNGDIVTNEEEAVVVVDMGEGKLNVVRVANEMSDIRKTVKISSTGTMYVSDGGKEGVVVYNAGSKVFLSRVLEARAKKRKGDVEVKDVGTVADENMLAD